MKLIEIKKVRRVIFVGDTHGDLDASQKVLKIIYLPAMLRSPVTLRVAMRAGMAMQAGNQGIKLSFWAIMLIGALSQRRI